MKIALVIDDEGPIRSMYDIFGKSKGYEVITAKNGIIGLKYRSRHMDKNPDVIICDGLKGETVDGITFFLWYHEKFGLQDSRNYLISGDHDLKDVLWGESIKGPYDKKPTRLKDLVTFYGKPTGARVFTEEIFK